MKDGDGGAFLHMSGIRTPGGGGWESTAPALQGVWAGSYPKPRSRSNEGVPNPRLSDGLHSLSTLLPFPAAPNPTFAGAPGACGTAGRRDLREARPFDVHRRRCDWTVSCDVRGLRWARVLRQPQRQPRLRAPAPEHLKGTRRPAGGDGGQVEGTT